MAHDGVGRVQRAGRGAVERGEREEGIGERGEREQRGEGRGYVVSTT